MQEGVASGQDELFRRERHDRIKHLIAQRGRVNTGELAAVFGVSRDTIKRDLRALDEEGVLLKIYGGAVVPSEGGLGTEPKVCPYALERVANCAMTLIRPGQSLFFDPSDESVAIAERLPTGLKLHIMTVSSRVLRALQYSRGCEVVSIGGAYDVVSGSVRGSGAMAILSKMRADLFFVGGCKMSQEAGATASDPEDAEIKREMVSRSREVAVLGAAGLHGTAAHVFAAPDQISHVIAADPENADVLSNACRRMAVSLQLV